MPRARSYTPWTDHEKQRLADVWPEHGTPPTDDEFQAAFPSRSLSSIRNMRQQLGITRTAEIERERTEMRRRSQEQAQEVAVDLSTLPDDTDDWDGAIAVKFADAMAKARMIAAGIAPSHESTTHTFADRLPIGIAFVGDFHVGGSGVDWFRLKDDLKVIGETDGLYAIGMGDYAEGVTGSMGKLSAALHGLGGFPDRRAQQLAIIEICRQVSPKWLAFAEGNHDGWSDRQAAYNFTHDIARDLGAPFFREAGGSVYVTVGQTEYLIAVAHDWHGKSRINPSNKQRRMFEEWATREHPDVVCTAHTHHNLAHQEPKNGMDPVYLNSGTYKTADRYSLDRKFRPGLGVPMVLLYPDERVVVPIYGKHFRSHGLHMLASERARYAQKGAA